MIDTRTQQAISLMSSFALRTGLSSDSPNQRYLWTDAFAVCNYLGLAGITGDPAYRGLALKLVGLVHHTLGKHRQDDPRSGWLSGLGDEAGESHPTRSGLRIGKDLPERTADEAFDQRLEWERDGQYFHYLTKWMHALDQVARATGKLRYNIWARELAVTAFDAFTDLSSTDAPRMVWKMSIDLTRPLVPFMGKHDPLDGYITSLQLAALPMEADQQTSVPTLENEIDGFERMITGGDWVTDDALGLGGLLVDAWRLMQLQQQGVQLQSNLLETLLDAAIRGMGYYARSGELQQPPEYRLAFRELGLAIGLQALERMQRSYRRSGHAADYPRLRIQLDRLMQYSDLREYIETFWLYPEHRQSDSWTEHRDINEVMLATSLAPDGFLDLIPLKTPE